LAALSASLALAEDFTTTNGEEYKNVAVIRVDPDGIVIRTKSAIVKLSWWELPKDVADKWLAPIRAAERAAEENRIKEQRAAEEKRIKEQQAAEEKRAVAERERTERENKAGVELKPAIGQFQAAEQRASQTYQSAAKGAVSGQVFISSSGGQSFKLGAVQVGLFARDAIDVLLPALKRYADFQIQASGISGIYRSGSFYFDFLQSPIQTAETDADGRFVMQVPKTGAYVIAARGARRVGGDIEHYYWLQPVSLGGQQQLSQNLSNNNLTSTTGTSSLIVTQD
jgi:hypothetical protein